MNPILLAAAAALCAAPAAGVEVEPADAYVAATTVLGAAGGALAGAALGGISRTEGSGRVTPYLRWGGVGTVFGGILGYDIGHDALSRARRSDNEPIPPSREVNSCVVAILGEGLGFGAAAAIMAANHAPLGRNSKEAWTGVSVGALLGAVSGFLIKDVRLMPSPPPHSRSRRVVMREASTIEPLVPVPSGAAGMMRRAEPLREEPPQSSPAMSRPQLHDLEIALLEPEHESMIKKPEPIGPLNGPQLLLSPLPLSHEAQVQGRSVLLLGQVAGLVLGAAGGGSLSGEPGGFYEQVALGGALGTLAGWSAASALKSSWSSSEPGTYNDTGEIMAQGTRISGTFASGLIGAAIGGVIGAVLQSSADNFDRTQMARCALAGNLVGLFAGSVLTPTGN